MTVARVGVAKVWVAELGVAKKRWQKRGDKKEVVEKANGGRNSGVAKKGWPKRGGKKEVTKRGASRMAEVVVKKQLATVGNKICFFSFGNYTAISSR